MLAHKTLASQNAFSGATAMAKKKKKTYHALCSAVMSVVLVFVKDSCFQGAKPHHEDSYTFLCVCVFVVPATFVVVA